MPERLVPALSPPAPAIRLRSIALPVEHGGWGLLGEPLVVVGLAIAPSLARDPLKLAAGGRVHGNGVRDSVRGRARGRLRVGVVSRTTQPGGVMEITQTTQVGELASQFPATIKVFQEHGVDFCCGGRRPLGDVCAAGGPGFEALRVELARAIAGVAPDTPPLGDLPLGALTAHIVERYHGWIRRELDRVRPMMEKVLRVHGERHPELAEIARVFAELEADLAPHMMKEERVLFPFLAAMADAPAGATIVVPFGTVQNPIRMMEMEHEAVGGLLARMRALTNGFEPPEDGCNTFRGLYHAFVEIERDTHEHIHVENNILHPRAIALEAQLLSSSIA
jgi:regulator of cell morphogenesis and NO signaling